MWRKQQNQLFLNTHPVVPGVITPAAWSLLIVVCATVAVGCRSAASRLSAADTTRRDEAVDQVQCASHRDDPSVKAIAPAVHLAHQESTTFLSPDSADEQAKRYKSAIEAEKRGDARCVDFYFEVARTAWSQLARDPTSEFTRPNEVRTWNLYHHSLERLILAGQQFGRLDPTRGILVHTAAGPGYLTITRPGSPWSAEDYNLFVPAWECRSSDLKNHYRQAGWGVPLVAIRVRDQAEPFRGRWAPFATTAILRPLQTDRESSSLSSVRSSSERTTSAPGAAEQRVIGVLELHDPLHVSHVEVEGNNLVLAADTSAPLALARKQLGRENIQNFMSPGRSNANIGLRMVDPYEPGRFPIVLVHGLLSDKFTWANLANELRAVPWINQRFQFWTFQYETGEPFLSSAAALRAQIPAAIAEVDPQQQDRALRSMILIGHSMGGLVSKLQVTQSDTRIWDRYADQPISSLVLESDYRDDLEQAFFFEPQPFVDRVVFIATPHRGSSWAASLPGRLAARLVHKPQERQDRLNQVLRDNPGVFSSDLERGIPSSVELLKETSPLLDAMTELRFSPSVKLHSIIGNGRSMLWEGAADGIVPVHSAQHPGVQSEKVVDARHTDIIDNPETIHEIIRILRIHVLEHDRFVTGQLDSEQFHEIQSN